MQNAMIIPKKAIAGNNFLKLKISESRAKKPKTDNVMRVLNGLNIDSRLNGID